MSAVGAPDDCDSRTARGPGDTSFLCSVLRALIIHVAIRARGLAPTPLREVRLHDRVVDELGDGAGVPQLGGGARAIKQVL